MTGRRGGGECEIVPRRSILQWLNEHPGWWASIGIWNKMGKPISYHRFRRRVQSLREAGLIAHRTVKPKGSVNRRGLSRRAPVYEYRRLVDIDDFDVESG